MCGIAGFFQTKYNISNEQTYYFLKNKLEKMKNAIKHRVLMMTIFIFQVFLTTMGSLIKQSFQIILLVVL